MQTVLVTGGAGFIGTNFVRHWLAKERDTVVNLDKLTYAGNLDSLSDLLGSPRHVFVEGDIGDDSLVGDLLFRHQPRLVVNFAAETHVDRSIDGPAAFVQTNVVGTFRLLESVRRYWEQLPPSAAETFRILHVSTDEVYGALGPEGKFSEASNYAPNSPYAASKAAGDHFVRAYHHTYRLPALLTNCSNNFGPYQFPEKLIPLTIINALEGKDLPVYGDGRQVRDWIHVEDHCRALRLVLQQGRPGQSYNIGGDCEQFNIDLVEQIAALVDRLRPDLPHRPCRQLIRFVADRPGHDRRYAIDSAKVRGLGWAPTHSFAEALEQTVRWYIDHRAWAERVTLGKYRRERLGLPLGM